MSPSFWDSPSLLMLKSYWNCAPIQGRPRDSGSQKVQSQAPDRPGCLTKVQSGHGKEGQSNQTESPGRATEDSKKPQSGTVAHSGMRGPGVPVAIDALAYVLEVLFPSFNSS